MEVPLRGMGDNLDMAVHSFGKIKASVERSRNPIGLSLELSTIRYKSVPWINLDNSDIIADDGSFRSVKDPSKSGLLIGVDKPSGVICNPLICFDPLLVG